MNGGRRIIDVDALAGMARSNAAQADMAARLGVTQQAISQAIRKHNLRQWQKRHGDRYKKENT
jgi:predicted transcriptional regulator